MEAANASARGQRHAILSSPIGELTRSVLTVDCRGAQCGGERSYAITALAACYRPGMTVGEVFAPDALCTGLWRPSAGGLAGQPGRC
jgi:hypothetical protein